MSVFSPFVGMFYRETSFNLRRHSQRPVYIIHSIHRIPDGWPLWSPYCRSQWRYLLSVVVSDTCTPCSHTVKPQLSIVCCGLLYMRIFGPSSPRTNRMYAVSIFFSLATNINIMLCVNENVHNTHSMFAILWHTNNDVSNETKHGVIINEKCIRKEVNKIRNDLLLCDWIAFVDVVSDERKKKHRTIKPFAHTAMREQSHKRKSFKTNK